MSAHISPAFAGANAAVLFGGNVLGLGRAVAGATAFTTIFVSEKFIEDLTDQVTTFLSDNNIFSFAGDDADDLLSVAQDCMPIAASALTLYASMYAVTTVLSLASISVATLSIPGALGVSLITPLPEAIANVAITHIQEEL